MDMERYWRTNQHKEAFRRDRSRRSLWLALAFLHSKRSPSDSSLSWKVSVVHLMFALKPGHLPVFRGSNRRDAKRGGGRRHFYFVPRTVGDRCAGGGGQRDQHGRAVAWFGS